MIIIRNFQSSDYTQVIELYNDSTLYGGQFDENRDSEDKINNITKKDPEAILVAEVEGKIVGTISLIEDGRVAWLFRFAVLSGDISEEVTKLLYEKAVELLKVRGHNQVLVYAPTNNSSFEDRYVKQLNFQKGSDLTCYWKDI